MNHKNGDRVTNTVPIGPEIPTGTEGTITSTHEYFGSYGVTYDNHPGEMAMEPNEIKATT
jgi:hypothetical protein